MFKHILVAVDGTPTSSSGALDVAAALASENRGTLHVLHVVDERLVPPGFVEGSSLSPAFTSELMAKLRAEGRKVLANATKVAAARRAKVNPLLVADSRGAVAIAILLQAKKVQADLIVLGTHGRRGIARVLMGSDAEMVLREASVPVLLVRAQPPKRTPKRTPTAARMSQSPKQRVRLSIVSPAS